MEKQGFELKFGTFCIFFGAAMARSGWTRLFNARRALDQGAQPIATASPGLIEVLGHVRSTLAPGSLVSPLSGRPAVYFTLTVELKDSDRDEWTTLYSRKTDIPFIISDSSGSALIRPTDVDLNVTTIQKTWNELTEDQKEILVEAVREELPEFSERIESVFPRSLRVIEKSVAEGCQVYTVGDYYRVSDLNAEAAEWHRTQITASGESLGPQGTALSTVTCQGAMLSTPNHRILVSESAPVEVLKTIEMAHLRRLVLGVFIMMVGFGVLCRKFI